MGELVIQDDVIDKADREELEREMELLRRQLLELVDCRIVSQSTERRNQEGVAVRLNNWDWKQPIPVDQI